MTAEINRLDEEAKLSPPQSPSFSTKRRKNESEKPKLQMPFITQSKSFFRGLAQQTQEKKYFSHIVEMNECFPSTLDKMEAQSSKVSDTSRPRKIRRKRLRISSDSDSDDDDLGRKDGAVVNSFIGLETKGSTMQKEKLKQSTLRKYSNISEVKKSKKKQDETTNKRKLDDFCLEEKDEDEPAKGIERRSPTLNLDRSLDKLSQDIFDLNDFEESKCFRLESSRNSESTLSPSLSSNMNTLRCTTGIEAKKTGVKTHRKLHSKRKTTSDAQRRVSSTSNQISKLASRLESEDVESQNNKTVHSISLQDSSTNNLVKKLDLNRFAFTRTSGNARNKDHSHVKQDLEDSITALSRNNGSKSPKNDLSQMLSRDIFCKTITNDVSHNEDAQICNLTSQDTSENEPEIKIPLSTSLQSLENTYDQSASSLETKSSPSHPGKEILDHSNKVRNNSFLEKLKKFNFQKSLPASQNPTSKRDQNCEEKVAENLTTSEGSSNPFKIVSQNKTPSQGASLSQRSFNKDDVISIFDNVDENLDFDF